MYITVSEISRGPSRSSYKYDRYPSTGRKSTVPFSISGNIERVMIASEAGDSRVVIRDQVVF